MGAIFQQVGQLDQAWMRGLAARRVPAWLDRAFRLGTHLGGATFTILAGLVLAVVPETRAIGVAALVANTVSHLAAQWIKRRFSRRRPHLALEAFIPLAAIPDEYSFPSGHACAAMAVGATIAPTLPLLPGVGVLALAFFVGASRVYLRVHFVTDVIVGLLLGALGAWVGWVVVPG
jgi:membrane-associated phospholipid phosphatase